MKIQYHNRTQISSEEEKALDVRYASLSDLLKTSDVVCINCPLTDQTRGMIGEAEIASMKDGVFVINTGRGPVIDEKALINALLSGKIERAGLDVFDNEPNVKYATNFLIYFSNRTSLTQPFQSPFFMETEKCVVQPHVGSFSTRAWRNAYHECMANISGLFLNGKPVSPVTSF